ncbi:MAG: acyl-CoA thioesterase [Acidobacteria bacterium]|nr:acyl-CoA thioesterase [Acidobacteriota bacterium]
METAPMEDFSVTVPGEVTFRDVDAMGHANNAVYLTWFECGRIGYWKAIEGEAANYADVPFVLARTEIDFVLPTYAGERLVVGTRVTRLGNRSFDMAYRIERRQDGALIASGTSVQVMYDYSARASMPMPEEFRATVIRIEGHGLLARP